jgi:hypothetical protein
MIGMYYWSGKTGRCVCVAGTPRTLHIVTAYDEQHKHEQSKRKTLSWHCFIGACSTRFPVDQQIQSCTRGRLLATDLASTEQSVCRMCGPMCTHARAPARPSGENSHGCCRIVNCVKHRGTIGKWLLITILLLDQHDDVRAKFTPCA